MGVEEELLLVDPVTGEVQSSADAVLNAETDDRLTTELQQEQVETGTGPHSQLQELHSEIVSLRRHADEVAAQTRARVVALGTYPLPVAPRVTPKPRYEKMVERFGLTASEQLTCGCHVHVAVADDEEGVAVLDRIRPWLPVLLAVSANSPYWQGADSGYASFRSQSWSRWPSSGPTPIFGTPERYHSLVRGLIASGTIVDDGMIYFEARLSAKYPTVELRAADVCRRPEDAMLIAALARGLVETASREWKAGRTPDDMPTELLRVASWRAGRSGLDGELVHPRTGRPAPAREVAADLMVHVSAALSDFGDRSVVEDLWAALWDRGNGARAQRETFARTNELNVVVLEAVADGTGPCGTVR
ncbi:MAG: glutamate--cysteine ligase [Actinomycetota bacterium]|nr:glutamate--cysteine ligase [Actinomycetota bacterium]